LSRRKGARSQADPFAADTPTRRREERERAVSLLYESEMKDLPVSEVLADLPVAPDDRVVGLVEGVDRERRSLEELVSASLDPAWKLERLSVLDRIILLLASYELAHRPEVPVGAVINEAVDMAKHFSGPDAGRFVNGVAAAVAERTRGPKG